MESNRYAPPRVKVEGVDGAAGDAPALWSANAAACWSLLFTPIFGAWLHMLNWQALGETGRAESARTWAIFSALVLVGLNVGNALLPSGELSTAGWLSDLVLLLAWYFAGARAQVRWIAEHHGDDYPRRAWWQPLLGAAVLVVANALMMTLVGVVGAGWVRELEALSAGR
jgi:hypothetical protein